MKNYVQGDEMNNDLMPLSLLKPKEKNYDNDDEFIEQFLEEKRKQEEAAAALAAAELAALRRKKKSKWGLNSQYTGRSKGSDSRKMLSKISKYSE